MIRALKGLLALLALIAVGLGLRWTTAGSIGAVNSHDLISMAVVAIGTVAWMAYGWLVLAVLATVLEQIPGAIGSAASTLTTRITSGASRTLLRSALGVAAVTPLTVSLAHATPATPSPPPGPTTWRSTEPASTVRLAHGTSSTGTPNPTAWRATEPSSTVRLTSSTSATQPSGGTRPGLGAPTRPSMGTPPHAINPQTGVPRQQPNTDNSTGTPTGGARPRTAVPGSRPSATAPPPGSRARGRTSTDAGVPAEAGSRADSPEGTRVRVGVPDRPTSGAATRYTDLHSGRPVRLPAGVVVKPGDTLWTIAAAELGQHATPEAIAARWPAWYATNRQLIGPDPDLILPGQVLRTPASAAGNHMPPTHQEK